VRKKQYLTKQLLKCPTNDERRVEFYQRSRTPKKDDYIISSCLNDMTPLSGINLLQITSECISLEG